MALQSCNINDTTYMQLVLLVAGQCVHLSHLQNPKYVCQFSESFFFLLFAYCFVVVIYDRFPNMFANSVKVISVGNLHQIGLLGHWATGLIRSSSRDVRPFAFCHLLSPSHTIFVVPEKHRGIGTLKNVPTNMYIITTGIGEHRCTSTLKNVQTKIYIITTGIGEHSGIGTLKKYENRNVHHYNWQSGGGGGVFSKKNLITPFFSPAEKKNWWLETRTQNPKNWGSGRVRFGSYWDWDYSSGNPNKLVLRSTFRMQKYPIIKVQKQVREF